MGAGHSFLVLEEPLSEDTHSLDPAPDKSGGSPPDFFFEALFSQHFIFLPSSFLSSYSPNLLFFPVFSFFFYLHIGILIIIAIAVIVKTSLDLFLQVRLPYPELPHDVPHLWPPPVVRPVSPLSHTLPSLLLWRSHSSGDLQRPYYQELTPTTLMGALLPISQLHQVLERYSFLPQFLFLSSIARINILPYIGARAHERA